MGVQTRWSAGVLRPVRSVRAMRPSCMTIPKNDLPITLSIGIMTWNEEASIGPMLASLFGQSVFARLAERGRGLRDRLPRQRLHRRDGRGRRGGHGRDSWGASRPAELDGAGCDDPRGGPQQRLEQVRPRILRPRDALHLPHGRGHHLRQARHPRARPRGAREEPAPRRRLGLAVQEPSRGKARPLRPRAPVARDVGHDGHDRGPAERDALLPARGHRAQLLPAARPWRHRRRVLQGRDLHRLLPRAERSLQGGLGARRHAPLRALPLAARRPQQPEAPDDRPDDRARARSAT